MLKRGLCLLLCLLLPCAALGETYKRDADWPATFDYETVTAMGYSIGYNVETAAAENFAAKLAGWLAELGAAPSSAVQIWLLKPGGEELFHRRGRQGVPGGRG